MNKSTIKLLSSLSQPGQLPLIAIDVGAHHGHYSESLIQSGFFERVIAFEPNPDNLGIISERISLSASCTFELIPAALGANTDTSILYFDDNTATASLLQYGENYKTQGNINEHSVPVTTLDLFCDGISEAHRLSFLKVDTQGNDLEVIKGGQKCISKHRPVIQVELIFTPLYKNQCTPKDIYETLNDFGYEMYTLSDLHVDMNGRLIYCDCLFIPSESNLASSVDHGYICIDDRESLEIQIKILSDICKERLELIQRLDSELKKTQQTITVQQLFQNIKQKIISWVQ